MNVADIPTPALVVYRDKVIKNAQDMIKRCENYGVRLRGHFKTSKAVEAAEIQTGGTKRGMVVSTIPEANSLADNGFDDIIYGIPLSPDKFARCKILHDKLEKFHVMIDNIEMVKKLEDSLSDGDKKWSVFMSVDCGNHREGILHDSKDVIELAKLLHASDKIDFQGLYTHCGNSYLAGGRSGIQSISDSTTECLLKLVDRLKVLGIECQHYGMGSTPICSQPTESMKKVTEWHPGNYIFYDLWQELLGSCSREDIAVVVATRVIGHYPGEGFSHLLVDCGFTALTMQGKDKGPSGGFGAILDHPELSLGEMTQELGKITTVDKSPIKFDDYPIGTMLFILPYHSCATCDVHPYYYVVDKDNKVVDKWYPVKGW